MYLDTDAQVCYLAQSSSCEIPSLCQEKLDAQQVQVEWRVHDFQEQGSAVRLHTLSLFTAYVLTAPQFHPLASCTSCFFCSHDAYWHVYDLGMRLISLENESLTFWDKEEEEEPGQNWLLPLDPALDPMDTEMNGPFSLFPRANFLYTELDKVVCKGDPLKTMGETSSLYQILLIRILTQLILIKVLLLNCVNRVPQVCEKTVTEFEPMTEFDGGSAKKQA